MITQIWAGCKRASVHRRFLASTPVLILTLFCGQKNLLPLMLWLNANFTTGLQKQKFAKKNGCI